MDIMQAIVEIEKTARGIADATDALQQSYESDIQEEIKRREQETDQKVKARLEQLRMRMDAERQEEMEKLEAVYEQKLENLSQICTANQERWVQEITQAVIDFKQQEV